MRDIYSIEYLLALYILLLQIENKAIMEYKLDDRFSPVLTIGEKAKIFCVNTVIDYY